MYKRKQGFMSTAVARCPSLAVPRGPGSRGDGQLRLRAPLQLGKASGRPGAAAGVGGVSEGNRKGWELHGSVLSLHNESRENAWGKVGCRNKVLCLALEERVEM